MRIKVGIVVLALGLTAAVVPAASVAAAPSTPCLFSGPGVFQWIGGATGDFFIPGNWSQGSIPGFPHTDTPTAEVCIPSGTKVTLKASGVDLYGLDAEGTLVLKHGAQLFVGADDGTATAPDSIVNQLVVDSSLVGGSAKITVKQRLDLHSKSTAVSTMTTRSLSMIPPAGTDTTAPLHPGTTVLAAGATATIAGGTAADAGINLEDNRTFDIAGHLVIDNGGFIAADWGTALQLDATGVLEFDNDGGVYQGFLQDNRPWAATPAKFVNNGTIDKAGGTGNSVIDTVYSGNGAVQVQSGQLTIVGTKATATLSPGASIGFGVCGSAGVCTAPTTTAALPTAVTAELGAGSVSSVTVKLAQPVMGNPYRSQGLSAAGRPVVVGIASPRTSEVTILLDHSQVRSATAATMEIGMVAGSNHVVIPDCAAVSPVPPCVSSRQDVAGGGAAIAVLLPRGRTVYPLGPRFR